jgi:hypothetical protein
MTWRDGEGALALCRAVACGLVLAFGVTLLLDRLDGRQIGGEGVWVKPLKFQAAVALHLFTLALFASRLDEAWRAGWLLRAMLLLAAASAVFEVAYIMIQAGLRQPSHFNVATRFPAAMAVGAVVLTAAAAVVGVMVALDGQARLGPGLRHAVALGLIGGTVLTLVIAFEMGGRMTHHVGTPPQPESRWPVLGWSRDVGDLRPPHFFATHMMQAVPALGWLADRALAPSAAIAASWLLAIAWAGLTWWLFREALAGRPAFG